MQKKAYAVCGGGLIGLLLAKTLADSGVSVVVYMDKTPQKKPNNPMVYALNAASINLLKRLNLLHLIYANPVKLMHVCDQQHDFSWEFSHKKINQPAIAYIVRSGELYDALHKICVADNNIEIITAKLLKLVNNDDFGVIVSDEFNNEKTYGWLFAADGKSSWLREQLFVDSCWLSEHSQIAIITTIKLAKNMENTAWQKFLKSGPIAFLPRDDGYFGVIWSVEQELGKKLLGQNNADFARSLVEVSGGDFGQIKIMADRYSIELVSQYAKKLYKGRCVLVGDAARVILPLFGQGANLGCLDILAIEDIINRFDQQSLPNNSLGVLYQQARHLDGLLIGKLAELINHNTCWQNNIMAEFRGLLGKSALSNNYLQQVLLQYALGQRSFVEQAAFTWPDY